MSGEGEFVMTPDGKIHTETVDLDFVGCLRVGSSKSRIFVINLDAQLKKQGYELKKIQSNNQFRH